jgi:hypothetical protein
MLADESTVAYGFAMDFLQFYGSLSSNLVLLS